MYLNDVHVEATFCFQNCSDFCEAVFSRNYRIIAKPFLLKFSDNFIRTFRINLTENFSKKWLYHVHCSSRITVRIPYKIVMFSVKFRFFPIQCLFWVKLYGKNYNFIRYPGCLLTEMNLYFSQKNSSNAWVKYSINFRKITKHILRQIWDELQRKTSVRKGISKNFAKKWNSDIGATIFIKYWNSIGVLYCWRNIIMIGIISIDIWSFQKSTKNKYLNVLLRSNIRGKYMKTFTFKIPNKFQSNENE